MLLLAIYLVVTLVPLYLFIRLTMPAELRTIKITPEGLNEAFEEMAEDFKALIQTARGQ